MPSGQIVEIRIVEVTYMENGWLRKETLREVDPGMADGTSPQTPGDIVECRVCLGLFNPSNVSRCAVCGREHCGFQGCRGVVKISRDEELTVCAPCAKELSTGRLKRIANRFWRLGE
jgi:hypothetical protein